MDGVGRMSDQRTHPSFISASASTELADNPGPAYGPARIPVGMALEGAAAAFMKGSRPHVRGPRGGGSSTSDGDDTALSQRGD